jgi:hypothetical protein
MKKICGVAVQTVGNIRHQLSTVDSSARTGEGREDYSYAWARHQRHSSAMARRRCKRAQELVITAVTA